MFLVRFGCDPEWVLNLDMLAFNALAESAMRRHYQEQLDDTYNARLASQDEGKQFKKHMGSLRKLATTGSSEPDGADLAKDLSKMGAMR